MWNFRGSEERKYFWELKAIYESVFCSLATPLLTCCLCPHIFCQAWTEMMRCWHSVHDSSATRAGCWKLDMWCFKLPLFGRVSLQSNLWMCNQTIFTGSRDCSAVWTPVCWPAGFASQPSLRKLSYATSRQDLALLLIPQILRIPAQQMAGMECWQPNAWVKIVIEALNLVHCCH